MLENQYKIDLKVNGIPIELNSFVQNFFTNTLLGSLHALRDVPTQIESLTIHIDAKK